MGIAIVIMSGCTLMVWIVAHNMRSTFRDEYAHKEAMLQMQNEHQLSLATARLKA